MKSTVMAATLAAAAFLCPPATPAFGNAIASIVVDQKGEIFFSDYIRNRVWKISQGGELTSWVKGKHAHHLFLDESGTLYGEDVRPDRTVRSLWQITSEGVLTDILRATRKGRAVDYEGTVFTMDRNGDLLFLRDCQIVRMSADHRLSPWAGRRCSGDVWTSDTLRYGHLHGSLAWAPDGTLYFSDARSVRRVARDGSVYTLAGKAVTLFADPQPGEHRFDLVMGLAVDTAGTLYIADSETRSIHRIAPDGRITPVAKLPILWSPIGLGISGPDLYVVAQLRAPTPGFLAGIIGNPSVLKVAPDRTITTVATVRRR